LNARVNVRVEEEAVAAVADEGNGLTALVEWVVPPRSIRGTALKLLSSVSSESLKGEGGDLHKAIGPLGLERSEHDAVRALGQRHALDPTADVDRAGP
jgi:hypothetical protein